MSEANDIQMEHDLRRERDYWRMVACYLADCHAATAEYDGHLKGISKARRTRYASICHTAAQALRGHINSIHSWSVIEDAITRCERAVESLKEPA